MYSFLSYKGIETGKPNPVSVIICAHDEEMNLRELVPLLMQQQHPEFEVIIVEDRSNDATYDYLLEATGLYPKLKMVRVVFKPEHVSGKKFALTLGIKAAKYDWVILTDADCRPNTSNWLAQMSASFASHIQIALGFSTYHKKPGLLNSFIRFETFVTAIQYVGWQRLGLPYMGVGRNLAYRKSLFLDNKGFNSHLQVVGGDDDLFVNSHATKANTISVTGEEAMVISLPKLNWKDYYYQKLRHLAAGKKYKLGSKLLLGLFSVSWMAVWLFVVPAAFFLTFWQWIAALFVVRWAAMIFLFYKAPRKLGERFEGWKIPYLDFIYAFYYLVAGIAALWSKKIKWRV